VISSSQGLHAYSRQSTIIADESRLLEVDTAGRVVWSTENTQLDFYTGSIVASKARYPITPNARVYRYGENELLIVEPERNRVAIIDRAGAEIRTITQFIPDRVPLRDNNGNITRIIDLRNESVAPNSNYIAGAPTNLRNPTDVTVWTEFVPDDRNPYTNPQQLEYWIHYTITDAGNARVVDIVDRYQADPQTYTVGAPVQHPDLGPMLGVLYWMTPSQRLERNYRYVSAQRFEYWDGSQTRIGFATLVQNTAASAFEATGMGDPLDPRTPEAGMITLQLIVNGRDQTIYIRRMALPGGRVVPILAPVAIDTAKKSASGQGQRGTVPAGDHQHGRLRTASAADGNRRRHTARHMDADQRGVHEPHPQATGRQRPRRRWQRQPAAPDPVQAASGALPTERECADCERL
jgi:hypothetical protein